MTWKRNKQRVEWRWWIKWNTTKSRLLQEPYLSLHIQNHGMLFIYNHVLQQHYTWAILRKSTCGRGCAMRNGAHTASALPTLTETHPHYTCTFLFCLDLLIALNLLCIASHFIKCLKANNGREKATGIKKWKEFSLAFYTYIYECGRKKSFVRVCHIHIRSNGNTKYGANVWGTFKGVCIIE